MGGVMEGLSPLDADLIELVLGWTRLRESSQHVEQLIADLPRVLVQTIRAEDQVGEIRTDGLVCPPGVVAQS
jgi:hypothetical protein